MPIRGHRNPMPARGQKPTGMFGSPQKVDSTAGYRKDLVRYAHSGGGEVSGKPSGSEKGLRHQPPKKRS